MSSYDTPEMEVVRLEVGTGVLTNPDESGEWTGWYDFGNPEELGL